MASSEYVDVRFGAQTQLSAGGALLYDMPAPPVRMAGAAPVRPGIDSLTRIVTLNGAGIFDRTLGKQAKCTFLK